MAHPLARFVRALQDAEYSDAGATLNLTVRYRHDESDYVGWPLPLGDYILEDGLRDPGFGSGPVSFSAVEWVRVERAPHHGPLTDAYQQKLQRLATATGGLEGVSFADGAILFRNDT